MTSRERNLATVLLVLLLGGGGLLLAKMIYVDPAKDVRQQLDALDLQISAKENDLRTEADYVSRIKELSPRLGRWEKISLPAGDNPQAPSDNHLATVGKKYQDVLEELFKRGNFTTRDFKPLKVDTRSAPQLGRDKPLYHVFGYTFEGEADLRGIVTFLEGLYRTPLLHQIKKFSITNQRTSKENNLELKMTIEVLMINHKNTENISKRDGILPKFDAKLTAPAILASVKRNYQQIASKNPFTPDRDRTVGGRVPGEDDGGEETAFMGEKPEEVFPFVRLSMIAYSDYYDAWIARIYNPSNKDDFNKSTLVTDKPLPPNSRFMKDKKAAEKNKALAETIVEPTTRYQVRNRTNEVLLDMQIVRIDPLRVIFQAKGELRILTLNSEDGLEGAMSEDALSKEEIKKLGLSSGRDETLKKVTLKELKYRKDRDADRKQVKGYEAIFVNPDNKDEKAVLATEPLPEEFSAEDRWAVKDRIGSDLVKLQVVRVDKDAAYFKVDRKFYRIRAGENLAAAMEKPLAETEVKALQLGEP